MELRSYGVKTYPNVSLPACIAVDRCLTSGSSMGWNYLVVKQKRALGAPFFAVLYIDNGYLRVKTMRMGAVSMTVSVGSL